MFVLTTDVESFYKVIDSLGITYENLHKRFPEHESTTYGRLYKEVNLNNPITVFHEKTKCTVFVIAKILNVSRTTVRNICKMKTVPDEYLKRLKQYANAD